MKSREALQGGGWSPRATQFDARLFVASDLVPAPHLDVVRRPEDVSDMDHALRPPEPVLAAPKVGRNDPCPCGSGKKFKKCCASALPPGA